MWPPSEPLTGPFTDQYTLGSTQVVKQVTGDTTFYFIPTTELPLLDPLRSLGVPESLLNVVQPALQVIVEAGYDRSIPFGDPTPAQLIPTLDPATFTLEFANAVVQGADNAFELFGAQLPDYSQLESFFTSAETWSEQHIGVPYDQLVTELNNDFNPFTAFTALEAPLGIGIQNLLNLTGIQQGILDPILGLIGSLGGLFTSDPAVTHLTPPAATTTPGLTAVTNPTTLLADLAQFSQLTSFLDRGTTLASPVGTATGLPALTPAAAPMPSATTPTADTKTGQPTRSTNSDATIASTPASQPNDAVPQTNRATVDKHPVSNLPAATGGSSPTASSVLTVPVVTRPAQPMIRPAIGANQSGRKTTATTAPNFGEGPVSKVLGGQRGGPTPSTAPNANSKTPAGKAGKS